MFAVQDTETVKASFERAYGFLKSGDAKMAEQLCRTALEEFPLDGNLRCLFGITLMRQGKHKKAERQLRRVTQQYPEFAKAHEELGNARLAMEQPDEALFCFERAVQINPQSASAYMKLAMTLSMLGRSKEADQAYEASFKLEPNRKALVQAAEHQRAGNWKEAEKIYREVLRLDPDNVDAMRLLATVAAQTNQYGDAVVLLRRAVELKPAFIGAWNDLSVALQRREQFVEAVECSRQATRLGPMQPKSWLILGEALAKNGDRDEAIATYEQGLTIDDQHGPLLSALGNALKTVGRQKDAIAAWEKCIRHYPAFAEVYYSLANLKTYRLSDAQVATMEEQLEQKVTREESRVNFHFALGKAYEDQGDYKTAFDHYETGNHLRRMHESYDPLQTELIHDRIIEVFSQEFVEQKSMEVEAASKSDGPAPIFIVGLPRSGSTLIEQILASHSLVEGTHELTDLSRVIRRLDVARQGSEVYPEAFSGLSVTNLNEVGQRYIDSTAKFRSSKPYFIDKMPNNFSFVAAIRLILPQARIINARRHPLSSCMGTFKQLFYDGQSFSYDLQELALYYLEYQRMMDHWNEILPGFVLDVHYEKMVADQEAETRRLIEFCDLPWEDACLRFYETDRAVNTASSEQVRQPIYRTSVDAWRGFEPYLDDVIEDLEPLLRSLPEEQRPKSLL